MIVKTNVAGYLKDTRSGMVLNTNDSEYQRYLAEKKRVKTLASLTDRMAMIEKLLEQITKGKVN